MKQIRELLMITFIVVIIVGCSQIATPVMKISTNTPVPSREPTSTFAIPTATPNISNSIGYINTDCVRFTGVVPSNISGKIAAVEYWTTPLIIDIKTGQKQYLGGEIYSTVRISPDHKLLAYLDTKKHQIIITNPDGKVLQTLPALQDWRRVLGWLENEKLLIENFRTKQPGLFTLSSIVSLDLATDKYQEYLPIYPDIMSPMDNAVHWGIFSTTYTIYNSDFTQVIYAAQDGYETPIILWNIQEQREVGRIHSSGYYFATAPQWSPDGTRFVASAWPIFTDQHGTLFRNTSDDYPYLGGTELFSMSREGVVNRLTFLTTKQIVSEENYAWSPDGNSIAFWLTIDKGVPQLAILNISTGEVRNLCVPGGDYGVDSPALPVWSPDSDQLIISTPNEKSHPKIVLIDLKQKTAVMIAEDAEALGWMVK